MSRGTIGVIVTFTLFAWVGPGCGDSGSSGNEPVIGTDTAFGGGSGSGTGTQGADATGGTDTHGDVTLGPPPTQDTSTGPTPDTTTPTPDTTTPTPDTTTPTPDTTVPPDPVNTSSTATSPSCVDGQYTEVLPTPAVSLDSEIATYTTAGYLDFIDAVLEKRYPIGGHIVSNALLDTSWGHCIDVFLYQKDTADQVIDSMSTLVHECGHFLDSSVGGWDDAYVITDTLTFECSGGSTPDNGGGKTFSRSLITADPFSDLWPPCASFGSGGPCDSYAPIYLDGDPDDATFDSGDQGFGSLLEETVQYVNSLATGYAFNDFQTWGVSERDGILTFLWYVQRYLRLARLEHPTAYNHLMGSSCWREAILTVWGRAWMYLVLTEAYPQLGIDDGILEPLALNAELNEEIQLVREAHGCQ